MPKRNKWLYAGSMACLLIVADAGVAEAQRNDERSPRYVDLTAAQAEQLEAKVNSLIREVGVIQSVSVTDIRARTGGTLIEFPPEGTEVKKGDRIGQLDTSTIENDIAIQRIAIAKKRAEVNEARRVVENRKQELESAAEIGTKKVKLAELRLRAFAGDDGELTVQAKDIEDQIEASEKVQVARETELSRVKRDQGAQIAEGRAMVAVASAEVASLKRKQKLHGVMTELTTFELSLAVAEEKADLANAIRTLDAAVQKSHAALDVAQQAEDVEILKLKTLEQRLAGAVLTAPQEGVLLYPTGRRGQTPMEPGTVVRERQTVGQVADMANIQVAVLVNETQVPRVSVGQPATIQIDAYANREFKGTVKRINRTPEPASFMDNSGKKYKVLVSLEKPLPDVRLGMTAVVSIDTTK